MHGTEADYDDLLARVGESRIVLLGEASHGSHEFYAERDCITRRLIEEKGFTAIAVEADWPDAYRVNRYVLGASQDTDANAALGGFQRFPAWMWRNEDATRVVAWLRAYNQSVSHRKRVHFYGLDLYSLRASMEAVISYLDSVDADAADEARRRYSCFDQVRGEGPEYGHAVSLDLILPCEREVVAELESLRRRAAAILSRDGERAEDEFFYAEQNARLVHNAERYYRAMYHGRISSWNLRDQHMAATLAALVQNLDRRASPAKVVVWEHNSHVGDARATELGWSGELNVGQLVRKAWSNHAFIVGFTTYDGEVTAASEWGGPAERKVVRPALEGSYEHLFHQTGVSRFVIPFGSGTPPLLRSSRLERAIGVIYRPRTERQSHWFKARMPDQFDAVVHIDHTEAVVPLERTSVWDMGEPPETYPSGL